MDKVLLSSLSHPPIGSLCSLPSIPLSHLRFNTTREVSSKEKKLPSKPVPIPAFPSRISRPFDTWRRWHSFCRFSLGPSFSDPSLSTRCGGIYSLISLFRIAASSTPLSWSFGMNFVIIRRPPCGLHVRLSRVG